MKKAASLLAEWTLSGVEIPEAIKSISTDHFFDGLGNALGALREKVPTHEYVKAMSGSVGESFLLGTDLFTSAPNAALSLGALIHHLDFDDTHAGGLIHATAVSLPAAISVGSALNRTWAEVKTAGIFGLEIACRIALGSPHGFHARGLHATHISGTISSAVVTGVLHKVSPATLTNGIGIAASASGGLLEFLNTGSSTKQLHPGMASLNGVLSLDLARYGATGPESALEGKYGIYQTHSNRAYDIDAVVSELGSRWEAGQITIKPYPACQLSHACLDAVAVVSGEIRNRLSQADEIKEILLTVHPDSADIVATPESEKWSPRTPYDAKFSLQWSVAALILDGGIGVETYSPESILRPEVSALAQKVSIKLLPKTGVAADAPGHAVVQFLSGQVIEGEVQCSAGGPRLRLSKEALLGKFAINSGAGMNEVENFYRILHSDDISLSQLAREFKFLMRGR